MSCVFDSPAYAMERDLIPITNRITAAGVPFNRAGAQDLYCAMEAAAGHLAEELQRQMPPLVVTENFIPRRDNKTKGYIRGVPFPKTQIVPFNPNSSKQIVERFMAMGWQPCMFTDTGEPSAAAAVLATLPYEEAKTLTSFRTTDKRMGMLSGEKGWLSVVDDDDRLRTEYHTLARNGDGPMRAQSEYRASSARAEGQRRLDPHGCSGRLGIRVPQPVHRAAKLAPGRC